jgi:Na+-transporting NADH:ubiquinone oxidoreductase subunit NqrC
MDALVEILKIILPAGAVFAAAYFIVNKFIDNDQRRRDYELKKTSQATVLPLKIQAYERLVIYLERIHPNVLVVRVNKHGMNSHQLHQELIKAVKSEYEHNLSQQIYVSYSAWELVKTAKEEIVKLVNISSTKVPHDNSSNDLAMMILNITANVDKKMPNEIALEFIKKEVSHTF